MPDNGFGQRVLRAGLGDGGGLQHHLGEKPEAGRTSRTVGMPSVTVPVLSNATTSTPHRASR